MTFISLDNIIKLFSKYWDKFLIDGVSYTLLLSAITVGFGALLACLIAWMKTAKIAPVRWLATAYIEIIRGTPMLLQLYFFYFALPSLIPALNKQKFLCIAIALICNSAAYVSEVIRSGLQSVDVGQTEAARSLGMSAAQCTWHIIVPQALRTILPALGNEFVTVIKESSIVSVIGLADLMFRTNDVIALTFKSLACLAIAALCYFAMTFTGGRLIALAERKMNHGK